MEVNKKKSDKEKFGEWFFKRQSKEVKKLIDKIDLDIKDIKMENNNQEPTRECCATGSLNCGMEGCKTCHSIKPPVEEKCKCDCFYSGRASIVEWCVKKIEEMKVEELNSHWLYLVKPEQAFIKALDDILQALKNKENE